VLSKLKAKLLKPFLAISAELLQLRADLKGELQQLRTETQQLRTETQQLRTETQTGDAKIAALFTQRHTHGAEIGSVYFNGLHGVGILNYQNDLVSGERRFLTRFIEHYPQSIVLDVGANAGQYSTLVRELGKQTVVHAFEPHPTSFAELAHIAGVIGVTAHCFALGESLSEIEFFDYSDEAGSQHASVYREVIEGVHRRPASSQKVQCKTLDDVAEDLSLTHIGLLKIDTEGHELAVLKGAKRLLDKKKIDVIQFEFNEMNVISRVFMKDFFDLLPDYRFYRLLADGAISLENYDPTFMEVFAFQNIVCIRRDVDPSWILRA
jgi:FkbM family methyltransferase